MEVYYAAHFIAKLFTGKLLAERFHITTGFRPGQRVIIEHLIQGKRILVLQRTGWGKSLCYQMASLYHPYLTLVFSPLKALMRDQCQCCNDVYKIPSAIVSSDFSQAENEATLAQVVEGEIKVLYGLFDNVFRRSSWTGLWRMWTLPTSQLSICADIQEDTKSGRSIP